MASLNTTPWACLDSLPHSNGFLWSSNSWSESDNQLAAGRMWLTGPRQTMVWSLLPGSQLILITVVERAWCHAGLATSMLYRGCWPAGCPLSGCSVENYWKYSLNYPSKVTIYLPSSTMLVGVQTIIAHFVQLDKIRVICQSDKWWKTTMSRMVMIHI